MVFYVFLCRSLRWFFCTGHFVMAPLNLTYLHCLQHSLFEHLFNLYLKRVHALFKCSHTTAFDINVCGCMFICSHTQIYVRGTTGMRHVRRVKIFFKTCSEFISVCERITYTLRIRTTY